MTAMGWLQLIIYVALLVAVTKPLGTSRLGAFWIHK